MTKDHLCFGILYGIGKNEIIVRLEFFFFNKTIQIGIVYPMNLQLPIQFIDKIQDIIFVRFSECDIETDDFGTVPGKQVNEFCNFGSGPWPPAFSVQAFFIDDRHDHDR